MSWNLYIDILLDFSKDEEKNCHVDKACIIGKEGAKWTTDEHQSAIKIAAEEMEPIVEAFEKKDFTALQTNGVKCEGITYKFLRGEDDTVLAKLKDHGALVIQCSQSAIVIAHMPEDKQQGKVNHAVGKLVEHLESQGY